MFVFISDRTRKQLKEGVLPSKNLPVRFVPKKTAVQRSTGVLEKRNLFQEKQSLEQHHTKQSVDKRKLLQDSQSVVQHLAEQLTEKRKVLLQETQSGEHSTEKRKLVSQNQPVEQHLVEKPVPTCYKNFNHFLTCIQRLKLKPSWNITTINDGNTLEITRKAENERFLLPFMEIFVNENLTYRLRCLGWLIPVENSIHLCHKSFKHVTFSDFIATLRNYHICSGLNPIEFKDSFRLQRHIIPLKFNFPSSVTDLPVNQQEYIRSVKCLLLVENEVLKCDSCKELEVKTRSELDWKNLTMMADTCVELSREAKVGRFT